jgi:hypothetical protein
MCVKQIFYLSLRCKNVTKKVLFCYIKNELNSMQNISNQIKTEISNKRKGKIFFLEDFTKFGNKNAVRQTLFQHFH